MNLCGVTVAKLQGHSWAPNPTNGWRVNVGTTVAVPSGLWVEGKARCQLMLPQWGGGVVVVRAQESCVQGEGLQRVRGLPAKQGGRW